MSVTYDPDALDDLLPIYYRRLFPYEPYCKWLAAGNTDKTFLARREFSFTLKDDIYLRYLSFTNHDELQKEMIKRVPHKIDIGAVYNARPSDHKKVSNRFFIVPSRGLFQIYNCTLSRTILSSNFLLIYR